MSEALDNSRRYLPAAARLITASENPLTEASQGRTRSLRYLSLALDSARADVELLFPGNVIYLDNDTTGSIYLKFDDVGAPALPLARNMFIRVQPFSKIFLTNAAQAGRVAGLWYGWDTEISPPNQDIGNIATVGVLSSVTPEAAAGSIYRRSSAASGLVTIVAPAANVNGIRLVSGSAYTNGVGVCVMTKASAPSGWYDTGALPLLVLSNGGRWQERLPYPLLIPAGVGLYEWPESASTATGVDLVYVVL